MRIACLLLSCLAGSAITPAESSLAIGDNFTATPLAAVIHYRVQSIGTPAAGWLPLQPGVMPEPKNGAAIELRFSVSNTSLTDKHLVLASGEPRTDRVNFKLMRAGKPDALAEAGMNRASIGVQDFDPQIQQVIGREQSYEVTKAAVDMIRDRGVASLNAVTRAEVQDFHRRYYTAANAVVAIVGDLDRPAAEQLANALVGGLPQGEPAPPLPPPPPLPASRTIRIPHPSSQSHILIGQIGVSRADPDYDALYLGNHVLGGNGLVSQLSQEIREKRGLANCGKYE